MQRGNLQSWRLVSQFPAALCRTRHIYGQASRYEISACFNIVRRLRLRIQARVCVVLLHFRAHRVWQDAKI